MYLDTIQNGHGTSDVVSAVKKASGTIPRGNGRLQEHVRGLMKQFKNVSKALVFLTFQFHIRLPFLLAEEDPDRTLHPDASHEDRKAEQGPGEEA